jgi:hypothetical protein
MKVVEVVTTFEDVIKIMIVKDYKITTIIEPTNIKQATKVGVVQEATEIMMVLMH